MIKQCLEEYEEVCQRWRRLIVLLQVLNLIKHWYNSSSSLSFKILMRFPSLTQLSLSKPSSITNRSLSSIHHPPLIPFRPSLSPKQITQFNTKINNNKQNDYNNRTCNNQISILNQYLFNKSRQHNLMRSPHSTNSRLHTQPQHSRELGPDTGGQGGAIIKKIRNYNFKLSDVVGRGAFSTVYKGYEESTEELVAIKVIELGRIESPALVKLLYSEVDILKSIKHPNILKCYDVYFSVNNCYIITEYCNGGDLKSLIIREGHFDEESARKVVLGVYEGLRYLSEENIVHRDIKTANIFMKEGQPKIADFGFAKRSRDNFKDINIGSPLCMSPEGIIDNMYGCKTDVWAFGILLYELFHGKTPFGHCKTQQELKSSILKPLNESIFTSKLSRSLKELILSCLEINVGYRISMGQIQNSDYLQEIKSSLQASNLLVSQVEEYRIDIEVYDSSKVSTQVPIPTERTKMDNKIQIVDEFPNFQDIQIHKEYRSGQNKSFDFKGIRSPREQYRSKISKLQRIDKSDKRSTYEYPLKNNSKKFREEKQDTSLDLHDRKLTIVSLNKDKKLNSTISNFKDRGNPLTRTSHVINPTSIHMHSSYESPYSYKHLILQNLHNFQDILSILHYCRLLFKTIKLCEKFIFRKLDYLGSWLFKILQEIKINIKRISDPPSKILSLKLIVLQYTNKYKSQLPFSFQPNLSVSVILSVIAQVMNQLQNKYPQDAILAVSYLVFFYDITELLGNAVARGNLGSFTKFNQIQQFLQAKEKVKERIKQKQKDKEREK